ncbi:MAG: hypothetical protein H0U02_16495, partial [Rubrobacter sp.]|nr:hypothetical protein [Rubrobacter sp.]
MDGGTVIGIGRLLQGGGIIGMERVRIAVTQFKARDIETFDDFAGHVAWHVDGAVWQGADCLVFPEY